MTPAELAQQLILNLAGVSVLHMILALSAVEAFCWMTPMIVAALAES